LKTFPTRPSAAIKIETRKMGADVFLSKPLAPPILLNVLEMKVKKKKTGFSWIRLAAF
jgi:hypothetical protein